MDPTRFDALTRVLSQRNSPNSTRRALLAALGGLLASALGHPTAAAAKQRRKKVRNRVRRRKHKGQTKPTACPTGQVRCATGCAGCCGDLDCGGNACRDGRCAACPRDQRSCRGGCIAETACCMDAECTGGRVCVEGACECRANERLCEGTCIPKDECCGTDCPPGGGGGTPQPRCDPETCNGCCDGHTCRQGDGQNFCGRDGVDCVACAAGESCDAGQCRLSGTVCAEGGCRGCCEGNTCKDGDSQNFCGRGGLTCAQCRRNETCNAGQCDCQTECCEDSVCVAEKETGGLCRPDGSCVFKPRNCQPAEESCDFGPCCSSICIIASNTCDQSGIGDACHTDADCRSGRCAFYLCVE